MEMHLENVSFSSFSVGAAGAQIVGRRERQEDSFRLFPADASGMCGKFLAVLSDGMGGMGDGDLAGRNVVDAFVAAYAGAAGQDLLAATRHANSRLASMKKRGVLQESAGGTLLAVEISDKGHRFLSIGDSLLFLQHGSEIRRINESHTWQWELDRRVQAGQMTPEQAAADQGQRSALYAAVCGDSIPAVQITAYDVSCLPGDRLIMASDGILPLVKSGWEQLLNEPQVRYAPAGRVCEMLLGRLEKLGAPRQDNATLVVLDIREPEQEPVATGPKWMASSISLLGDRPNQQDAEKAWVSSRAALAVLADGAGGHVGGAQAAALAVEHVERAWNARMRRGVSPEMAAGLLLEAVHGAHHAIIAAGGGVPERSGKCAFVAVYVCNGRYTVVNAGDCRAYISGEHGWSQITRDDSIFQLLLEQGRVKEQDSANHPDRSMLTQALGASAEPVPHVAHGPCRPGESFLLCCDGMWSQLPAGRLRRWPDRADREKNRLYLKKMAMLAVEAKKGASDNVSAIWLYSDVRPLFPWRLLQNGLFAVSGMAILLACACALWQIPGEPAPELVQQRPTAPEPEQQSSDATEGNDSEPSGNSGGEVPSSPDKQDGTEQPAQGEEAGGTAGGVGSAGSEDAEQGQTGIPDGREEDTLHDGPQGNGLGDRPGGQLAPGENRRRRHSGRHQGPQPGRGRMSPNN